MPQQSILSCYNSNNLNLCPWVTAVTQEHFNIVNVIESSSINSCSFRSSRNDYHMTERTNVPSRPCSKSLLSSRKAMAAILARRAEGARDAQQLALTASVLQVNFLKRRKGKKSKGPACGIASLTSLFHPSQVLQFALALFDSKQIILGTTMKYELCRPTLTSAHYGTFAERWCWF